MGRSMGKEGKKDHYPSPALNRFRVVTSPDYVLATINPSCSQALDHPVGSIIHIEEFLRAVSKSHRPKR